MTDENTSFPPELAGLNIPAHLAIIMDGNGRWAEQRGMKRIQGHIEGREATRRVIEAASEFGVGVLSVYAFSSENWRRPEDEVAGLMMLIETALREEIDDMDRMDIIFTASGRLHQLPQGLQDAITEGKQRTAGNGGLVLNLLVNYGGRAEIVDAARALAARVRAGEIGLDDIDEKSISANLYAPQLPEPDLLLRPGGESRISNFLLWEVAYSEIIIMPILWPDFSREHLIEAIVEYNRRQRRFGGIKADSVNLRREPQEDS